MLDSLDKRVLQQLKEDGRRSNVEIAKVLGVSESTVRNASAHVLRDRLSADSEIRT